jgi:hypothetical protein
VVAPVNSSGGTCGLRVRCVPVVLPDACQEAVEVGPGELPVEWTGGCVVVLLAGEDPAGELVRALEVAGGKADDIGTGKACAPWCSQAAKARWPYGKAT